MHVSGKILNAQSAALSDNEGWRAWIARNNMSRDVRDYAAERGIGVEIAVDTGLKEKSEEFMETGSEIYHKA